MHYFDKPSQFLKVDPETIKEQTLYRAKQAFDWNGDQTQVRALLFIGSV